MLTTPQQPEVVFVVLECSLKHMEVDQNILYKMAIGEIHYKDDIPLTWKSCPLSCGAGNFDKSPHRHCITTYGLKPRGMLPLGGPEGGPDAAALTGTTSARILPAGSHPFSTTRETAAPTETCMVTMYQILHQLEDTFGKPFQANNSKRQGTSAPFHLALGPLGMAWKTSAPSATSPGPVQQGAWHAGRADLRRITKGFI